MDNRQDRDDIVWPRVAVHDAAGIPNEPAMLDLPGLGTRRQATALRGDDQLTPKW